VICSAGLRALGAIVRVRRSSSFKRVGRGQTASTRLIVDGEPHSSGRAGQEALECLPRAAALARSTSAGELSEVPDTEGAPRTERRPGKDGKPGGR
jgi:hypothetical protein